MMFESRTRNLFRRLDIVWATCAAVAVAPAALGQIPCRYEVAAIIKAPDGPISDSPTYAMAISPNGEWVVGYYVYDGVAEPRGWYWHMPNGPFTPLPHPPGMFTSSANDVNDSGKVCGYIAGSGGDFGFVFDINTQQYTLLPPANVGGTCSATSINSSSTVCGIRSIGGGSEPTYPLNGFVWSPADGFTDLGLLDGWSTGLECIAENGHVVGWRGPSQAFTTTRGLAGSVSSPQVLPPVTGGMSSTCTGVNAAGVICGYGSVPSPQGGFDNRAFVWHSEIMTMIGVLPGMRRSFAFGVADDGLVVGTCKSLVSGQINYFRGFVWHDGVMVDVTSLVQSTPGTAVEIESVVAIDGDGHLVCGGYHNGEFNAALILTQHEVVADLNSDCFVNVSDLLIVINAWGTSNPEADPNGDGIVNVNDLLLVITNWTF